MMTSLTPTQRRLLASAILVAVVLILWFGLVAPLAGFLEGGDQSDRAQSLRLLTAYRQAAAQRPALETEFAALKKREPDIVGGLKADNAALAAASLQSELKQIVEQNGGEVRSSQTLQPVTADGYEKISIRYDLILPMKALQQLLYQIEAHNPYLFVDRADIRSLVSQTSSAAGAADHQLSIHWDIQAYRSVGTP